MPKQACTKAKYDQPDRIGSSKGWYQGSENKREQERAEGQGPDPPMKYQQHDEFN